MGTITLNYDAGNSTVRQLLEGLISSGLFQVQSEAGTSTSHFDTAQQPLSNREREAIHENMLTAHKMIADIRANGSASYQNMDTFLDSLK